MLLGSCYSIYLFGNLTTIPFACQTSGRRCCLRETSSGLERWFLRVKTKLVTMHPCACGAIHQLWSLQGSHSLMSMCWTVSFYGCHGEHGLWTSSVHSVVPNGHYGKKKYKLFTYILICLHNSSKGLYKKTLRLVVYLRDCYYLAIKELGCKECGKSFQCWDQR